MANQSIDPQRLLVVPLFHQIGEQLSKVIVADAIVSLQILVADGTFVLSIDAFKDAVFAESVAALRDVRIVKRLEAYDALGELANDIINAYLHCLIVLRLSFPQAWLLHGDVRVLRSGEIQVV